MFAVCLQRWGTVIIEEVERGVKAVEKASNYPKERKGIQMMTVTRPEPSEIDTRSENRFVSNWRNEILGF